MFLIFLNNRSFCYNIFLAVGDLFVAVLGQFKKKKKSELGEHAIAIGMKVFSHLTAIQIVVGLWFLLALEKDVMMLFMGRDIRPQGTTDFELENVEVNPTDRAFI